MLTDFEKAKISSLLPEIAQRTGISYCKLAGLLCPQIKVQKSFLCDDEPQATYELMPIGTCGLQGIFKH